jgi:polyisoprenoid-binding protein YceI
MNSLALLLASILATAPIVANGPTFDPWQIDSSHSTARFTLASSSGASWPYELAIAMVAGSLDWDASRPTDSRVSFSIYPAGEASRLLTREGGLRTGGIATLSNYSVLSFQSKRAFVSPDGKVAVVGNLTLIHVQRSINVDWSNSYSGPVYGNADEKRITGEVTFVFDIPASMGASGAGASAEKISGTGVIDRANFPGLWSALRDSEWPNVVLDEVCHTPYYVGPGLKDYKGATCTGTPVTVAPQESPSLTPPAIEAVGTIVPVPPTGDQVGIHVQLQMRRGGANAPWSSHD